MINKAFNDNIITVTAAKANSFTKNANGGFDVESDAIAIWSDLAMYNEDTTLSAPGWNIISANADFAASGEYYSSSYGTSMAAPIVTGVGALVQQAFPYLSGKQIGDVLLSTANSNITNSSGYFMTSQYGKDDKGEAYAYVNVYYMGPKIKTDDQIKNDVLNYYDNNPESRVWITYFNAIDDTFYGVGSRGDLEDALNNKNEDILEVNAYYNVPLDVIFGQGIVDAGKAVNGLGAINVRRLDKSDISSVNGKTKQALYKVDTQGYNSVWSNDIGEIRAGYIAENPLGDAYTKFEGTDSDIKDLHDRWVFYTTNSFDDNPADSKDHNWMTNHYMQQYNEQVAASGLAGLHAGAWQAMRTAKVQAPLQAAE